MKLKSLILVLLLMSTNAFAKKGGKANHSKRKSPELISERSLKGKVAKAANGVGEFMDECAIRNEFLMAYFFATQFGGLRIEETGEKLDTDESVDLILGDITEPGRYLGPVNYKLEFQFEFDDEVADKCTLDKDEAEDEGKQLVKKDEFLYSPGLLVAMPAIYRAIYDVPSNQIYANGIKFVHTNGSEDEIAAQNSECIIDQEDNDRTRKLKKKGRTPRIEDYDYYMRVHFNLGARFSDLEYQTSMIRSCLTQSIY